MARKPKGTLSAETQRNVVTEQTTSISRSTLRPFIMLTLIHAEEREIPKDAIIQRILDSFECKAVVLATEQHEDKGTTHYHIGIWTTDASKNTVRHKMRKNFPEWEGRSIDISLHKGWGSICKYIFKEDAAPLIWGEFNLQQLKTIALAQEHHKDANVAINNVAILKRLEQIEDWYQIYREDIFKNRILSALPRMKEAFEDLRVLKDIETNVLERIIKYLDQKEEVKEYDVEELKEKYLVIDWIACQLCFKRPIKTKQLFIYGEPSTQKTLLLNLLSKVMKIYFASARRNDFAGANDYYDLWAFDEFHEHSEQSAYGGETVGSTEEGSSFVNNLLKVLDGQECRLDSKYSRVFQKKRNVPIIMIANKLPQIMKYHGPFRARFYRIRFSTQIHQLEEERVIATLYGCIVRRAFKSPYYQKTFTPAEVPLLYNKANALIFPEELGRESYFQKLKEWKEALAIIDNPIMKNKEGKEVQFLMENRAVLLTTHGKVYQIVGKKVLMGGSFLIVFEILNIDGEECLDWGEPGDRENLIDLFQFATIPIRKRGFAEEEKRDPLKRLLEEPQEQYVEVEDLESKETRGTITGIKTIFRDEEESLWVRSKNSTPHMQLGQTQNEEVWSVITVQRNKIAEIKDFAMWPLEMKIIGDTKTGKGTLIKVFPAVIRNISSLDRELVLFLRSYYKELRAFIFDTIEETREQSIKCEISLSRNGEHQPWNLEC